MDEIIKLTCKTKKRSFFILFFRCGFCLFGNIIFVVLLVLFCFFFQEPYFLGRILLEFSFPGFSFLKKSSKSRAFFKVLIYFKTLLLTQIIFPGLNLGAYFFQGIFLCFSSQISFFEWRIFSYFSYAYFVFLQRPSFLELLISIANHSSVFNFTYTYFRGIF